MRSIKLLYIINVDWYFMLHWLDRANAAKESGYDVHIAMAFTEERYRQSLENAGFALHQIPLSRKSINPLTELRSMLAINKVIKQLQPTLVHSVTIKPNIYAGIACQRYSIRAIASITGLGTTFSNSHYGLAAIAQYAIRKLYKKAFSGRQSSVLFENKDDLSSMVGSNVINKEQAIHIPGAGVDTTLYTVSPEPPSPPVRILFAARLLKNKGLSDLVEAIHRLSKEHESIELVVAGIIDNDARGKIPIKQLEQWQQQGLIQWLGQVDDMPALLNRVNIVCLPTRYGEGIPRILIEAAASGRVLIATDVPGCREIIIHKKNGLLVKPGDQNELINALRTLINEPATRKKMGYWGRQLIEQKYSTNIVIRKTLDIYKQG